MKTIVLTPNTKSNYKDIYESRFLIFQIFKRDFYVRYKRTSIGLIWAILNPAFNIALYMLIFGVLIRIQTPEYNVPYSVVLVSGLILWALFSSAIQQSSDAITNNLHLVSKVFVPKLSLSIASLSVALIDFLIAMVVFAFVLFILDVQLSFMKCLLSILPIALTVFLAFSFGVVFSILKVKYRDFRHIMPLFIQAIFYLSPIVYSPSIVPEDLRAIYYLNPLAGIVELFRWCYIGGPINALSVLYSVSCTLALFVLSLSYFLRNEKQVLDFE